jgi:hypothetical protein
MPSSTDNFILMRPINAENKVIKPWPLTRNRQRKLVQKKESQQSNVQGDRSFAIRIPDIKMPIIGYWKNKDSAGKKAEGKDRQNECQRPLHKLQWENNGNNVQVRVTQGCEAARLGVKLWKSRESMWNINGQSMKIENSKLTYDVAVEGWVAESKEDLLDVKNVASGGVVVVMMNEQGCAAGVQQAYVASQDKVSTGSNVEEVQESTAEGYAVVCCVVDSLDSFSLFFVSGSFQIRYLI